MRRVQCVLLAAVLSIFAVADPVAAQFTIGGDPRVNPNDFRITTFATGLNFPNGLAQLSDGSILVATSNPNGKGTFWASSGELLRFTDNDQNGIADGPGQLMYSDPVGVWVAMKVAGPFLFITSAKQTLERIIVLRMNNGPASPYAFVGTLNFTFPANWEHKSYALAARPTPGGPANTYELYFNIGSTANFGESSDRITLSGLLQGTMEGASIYRVTVTDTGNGGTISNLTLIARGLRNAAGMDFHRATGDLYFEDNGIDGLQTRDEPLSADELNRIAAADLGRIMPNFGFPNDYIDYHTGQRVGTGGVQPLVTFRPLPCASCPDPGDPNGADGAESEGPSGIVFAPSSFPPYLNNGVFVGFHGKFSAPPSGNEENPLVFWDMGTGQYFHFIESFQLGHGDQLLSTENSLFIADMAADGIIDTNGGTGVVYQIKRRDTSLSVSPTSVAAGGSVTATWSGIASPSATDWIGLYASGAPDGSALTWMYVSCATSAGAARSSGSCSLTVPASVAAGSYEVRLFAANGFTRLATSPPFTVTTGTGGTGGTGGSVTLSASPSSVAAGASVTATWSGIASPSATDWIGLYAPGAPDGSALTWMYVSCSTSAGAARTSGSCSLTVPASLAAGSYELRLFAANGFTRLASSPTFTVTGSSGTGGTGGTVTLSASPSSVTAGASVIATWSGIASPSASDWIGLYAPGAPDGSALTWMYVSCSTSAGAARASGSCSLTVPASVAAGSYELRLFAANGFTRLARSNPFTVTR
jgi:glucose/arabinose dehydrogenase